ncbi:unnamed protein product, partial [Phaeothamnion confervicola]
LGSPILTESVLLDLLPISGRGADMLRSIQGEIEKATILRTLYQRANDTIGGLPADVPTPPPIPESVWDRVKVVGENALDMLENGRELLTPAFREVDTAEVQIRRAERGEGKISQLRQALRRLIVAGLGREAEAVLKAQEDSLFALAAIGELLVTTFPFRVTMDEQYETIPRLLGRATVELSMRRQTDDLDGGKSSSPLALGNVTLVVDGFSAPVTAGNFIDLCLRGFYNDLTLRFNTSDEMPPDGDRPLQLAIGGSYRDGFVDPLTGSLRRVPLEILRLDPKRGNVPFYGAARNTKVFTKLPPVQTFRIPGAVGMNHPPSDGNGGSSEFFWLTEENLGDDGYFMGPAAEALNSKYSIFAYAVGGRRLFEQLRPGDVIDRAIVTYGADNLIKTKTASLTELLLNSGAEGDDD